jgi:carboxyl-terminal processing protease
MINEPGATPRRTSTIASRIAAAFLVCILLVAGGVGIGYELGKRQKTDQVKADLSVFWQAWGILDKKFYGDTSEEKRVSGAITGMVAGLGDPYTTYFEPAQNRLFLQDLQGEFGGIGAELSVKSGRLVVVSSLPDTPAAKAGLRTNDIIGEIDGEATAEMSFTEAIDRIRGEKGTTVTLTLLREGETVPLSVALVRDTIVVKSVTADSVGANKEYAYIKVNQFGQDTSEAFRDALLAAVADKKVGVIIDMRGNPGGYLNASLAMIGMVLPPTTTRTEENLQKRIGVVERGKNGEKPLRAGTESVLGTTPIVVLVNEGSASASEIFAGAIKDYGRGQVVGEKTFGKGSVQELQDLDNGGSIKVTIAKWFTPLGTGIDGEGIKPDVEVDLPADSTPSTDDAQVRKALEILSSNTP